MYYLPWYSVVYYKVALQSKLRGFPQSRLPETADAVRPVRLPVDRKLLASQIRSQQRHVSTCLMRCLTRSRRFGHIILIILAKSVDEAAGHEELVRSSRSSRLTCRRRRVHVGDSFRRHRDELGCIHLDLHHLLDDASSACSMHLWKMSQPSSFAIGECWNSTRRWVDKFR